jgi:hypothetical protein
MIFLVLAIGASSAAASAHHPASSQCASMVQRYRVDVDAASRYAAYNAEVSKHISPTRQSAAQARESNAMARARMSLEAARSVGCRPAALAISPEKYTVDAQSCAIEELAAPFGGEVTDRCDPVRWPRR